MRFLPLLSFLLTTTLPAPAELPARSGPTTTTPAKEAAAEKPLTAETLDKLLAQLEEIDTTLQGKRSSYNNSLLPRLQEAGTNEDKAFALWLEAVRDQDYEAQGKSATEFSDFRNGKAKELRTNASFTTQLRLKCRFLALIILQSEAGTEAERLEVANGASAYLEDYISSAKKITGPKDEIRASAIDSVIAKHLKLDVSARKARGPAAYSAGSITEIYEQMILPIYREKKAASAISAAWSKRIGQETALVELNKVPEQLEKFQKERLPELKWEQAKDLFQAGQQEPAAASMVALIKANLGHRNASTWISELTTMARDSSKPSAGVISPTP